MTARSPVRRTVSWALIAAGVVVVIVSLIDGFTSDPQSGEGWGGGVMAAVFAGGPLLAVGAGLRSSNPHIARWTAVGAVSAATAVTFILVMQLLDGNETTANQAVTAMALVGYVLAAVVELPSVLTRRANRHRTT